MPAFKDNLYLGGAQMTPTDPDDAPSGFGVGPMGRVYLWDTVPAALVNDNIALAQTPAGAGALTLTAGAGVTALVNKRGENVLQFDVPRAIDIGLVVGGTARTYTVVGYDKFGQKMSENITTVANTRVAGKKAFFQILSITGLAGGSTTAITVGTTDVLGIPVRVTDLGYIQAVHWKGVLAQDAGTAVVADVTDPATTTTGDVRGTYAPSDATDGSKRLTMLIGIPAIGSGPNATRAGAYGVTQNLGTQ